MDDIDVSLIKILQANSRCTISELSKCLNLSRPSITERMLRLHEKGVIEEFSARISLRAIDRRVLIFIEISSLKTSPEVFEKQIAGDEDILECHRVSGRADYIIKAAVSSIDDMTVLINRLIPCGNLSTSVVLSSPIPYRHIIPRITPD